MEIVVGTGYGVYVYKWNENLFQFQISIDSEFWHNKLTVVENRICCWSRILRWLHNSTSAPDHQLSPADLSSHNLSSALSCQFIRFYKPNLPSATLVNLTGIVPPDLLPHNFCQLLLNIKWHKMDAWLKDKQHQSCQTSNDSDITYWW